MATAELVPMTELNFDKDDVAAIAIAEAEKKMRQNIKDLSKQITDCEAAIIHTKDDIQKQGEAVIETKTAAAMKAIRSGLKATKVKNFLPILNMSINVCAYNEFNKNAEINTYTISAAIVSGVNLEQIGTELRLQRDSLPCSQLQKVAMKKLASLQTQKRDLTNEALSWRKKLGDMPTLERQIKAALARDQVERTKEGKALVHKLITNFDTTVKLLGNL